MLSLSTTFNEPYHKRWLSTPVLSTSTTNRNVNANSQLFFFFFDKETDFFYLVGERIHLHKLSPLPVSNNISLFQSVIITIPYALKYAVECKISLQRNFHASKRMQIFLIHNYGN